MGFLSKTGIISFIAGTFLHGPVYADTIHTFCFEAKVRRVDLKTAVLSQQNRNCSGAKISFKGTLPPSAPGQEARLLIVPGNLAVGEYFELSVPGSANATLRVTRLSSNSSDSAQVKGPQGRLAGIRNTFHRFSEWLMPTCNAQDGPRQYCNPELQKIEDALDTLGTGSLVAGGMGMLPGVGWVPAAIMEAPILLGEAVLRIKRWFIPRICPLASETTTSDLTIDAEKSKIIGLPPALDGLLQQIEASGGQVISVSGNFGGNEINLSIEKK